MFAVVLLLPFPALSFSPSPPPSLPPAGGRAPARVPHLSARACVCEVEGWHNLNCYCRLRSSCFSCFLLHQSPVWADCVNLTLSRHVTDDEEGSRHPNAAAGHAVPHASPDCCLPLPPLLRRPLEDRHLCRHPPRPAWCSLTLLMFLSPCNKVTTSLESSTLRGGIALVALLN